MAYVAEDNSNLTKPTQNQLVEQQQTSTRAMQEGLTPPVINSGASASTNVSTPINAAATTSNAQGSGFGNQFQSINALMNANKNEDVYKGVSGQVDVSNQSVTQAQQNLSNKAQSIGQETNQFQNAPDYVKNVLSNPTQAVFAQNIQNAQNNGTLQPQPKLAPQLDTWNKYLKGNVNDYSNVQQAQNDTQYAANQLNKTVGMVGNETGRMQLNTQSAGANRYAGGMSALDNMLMVSKPQQLFNVEQNARKVGNTATQNVETQNQQVTGDINNLKSLAQTTAQNTQQALANEISNRQAQEQAAKDALAQERQRILQSFQTNTIAEEDIPKFAQELNINPNILQTSLNRKALTAQDQFGKTLQSNASGIDLNDVILNQYNSQNVLTPEQAQAMNALDILGGATNGRFNDLSQFGNTPRLSTAANLNDYISSQVANDNARQQAELASSQAASAKAYNDLINKFSTQDRYNAMVQQGLREGTPIQRVDSEGQSYNTINPIGFDTQTLRDAEFSGAFGTEAAKQQALNTILQRLQQYNQKSPDTTGFSGM